MFPLPECISHISNIVTRAQAPQFEFRCPCGRYVKLNTYCLQAAPVNDYVTNELLVTTQLHNK